MENRDVPTRYHLLLQDLRQVLRQNLLQYNLLLRVQVVRVLYQLPRQQTKAHQQNVFGCGIT